MYTRLPDQISTLVYNLNKVVPMIYVRQIDDVRPLNSNVCHPYFKEKILVYRVCRELPYFNRKRLTIATMYECDERITETVSVSNVVSLLNARRLNIDISPSFVIDFNVSEVIDRLSEAMEFRNVVRIVRPTNWLVLIENEGIFTRLGRIDTIESIKEVYIVAKRIPLLVAEGSAQSITNIRTVKDLVAIQSRFIELDRIWVKEVTRRALERSGVIGGALGEAEIGSVAPSPASGDIIDFQT